ncbi:hypothetical protein KO561_12835 [Radiobacillus kanasensis]|uniref:hypothetical protein n=1 Tax=Radiobacillus kanasensis TaxID=2844358 RepID=UPI001E3114A2|nr:hypothetical protein [Radiobacillus kanasensis]UFT98088.1 hypothetical protein KO561_12835 [Radiobacillus kanasensis]
MDQGLKRDIQHKPKPIPIKLDKERTFILDLNAYSELDMLYDDKSFNEILADFFQQRPYAIRSLLWACLVHEDENLTLKQVGKMLNGPGFNEAAATIADALRDDTPKHEPEVEGNDGVKKK